METARRLHSSHKRFLGWTPRRETTYVYEDGLLVRSVEWVENEWDDEYERGLMLALAQLEAEQCPLCGGPRSECQSIDADGAWDAHAVRCHKMTAIAEASSDRNTDHPEALLYMTVRRDDG